MIELRWAPAPEPLRRRQMVRRGGWGRPDCLGEIEFVTHGAIHMSAPTDHGRFVCFLPQSGIAGTVSEVFSMDVEELEEQREHLEEIFWDAYNEASKDK